MRRSLGQEFVAVCEWFFFWLLSPYCGVQGAEKVVFSTLVETWSCSPLPSLLQSHSAASGRARTHFASYLWSFCEMCGICFGGAETPARL